MAAIDALLEKMGRSQMERVVLTGDEPMLAYKGDRETVGAVIPLSRLQTMVQEILPTHLAQALAANEEFAFPYSSPHGIFRVSVVNQSGTLQLEISPNHPARISAVPPAIGRQAHSSQNAITQRSGQMPPDVGACNRCGQRNSKQSLKCHACGGVLPWKMRSANAPQATHAGGTGSFRMLSSRWGIAALIVGAVIAGSLIQAALVQNRENKDMEDMAEGQRPISEPQPGHDITPSPQPTPQPQIQPVTQATPAPPTPPPANSPALDRGPLPGQTVPEWMAEVDREKAARADWEHFTPEGRKFSNERDEADLRAKDFQRAEDFQRRRQLKEDMRRNEVEEIQRNRKF